MVYLKYVLYICVHKKTNQMEYKVIYGGSPKELTDKVNLYLNDGWEIVGSHQVVIMYGQNQFRGDQHISTRNEIEYSQTIVKK